MFAQVAPTFVGVDLAPTRLDLINNLPRAVSHTAMIQETSGSCFYSFGPKAVLLVRHRDLISAHQDAEGFT